MPHATHKARRLESTPVPHAPVRRRRSRFEQQALLFVAVGFTTLIIASLYAASFRSRTALRIDDIEYPRWTVLDEDFLERAKPVKDELANVKATIGRMATAGQTQVMAAAILKKKIEARASASGTPETAENPETPETP